MRALPTVRYSALATTLAVALAASALRARAQDSDARPLTRDEAVQLALTGGTRVALASATARAARAGVLSARALANPTLSAAYSKSVPQYHAVVDIPLDFLVRRPLQVSAALSASDAAAYRLAFERAAVGFEIDTLYTRAAAQSARAALSRANAVDADSLLTVARVRLDAGDASELDVELARVNAGQAENAAAADSLAAIATLLDLQSALGIAATRVTVALADTLAVPSGDSLAHLASASARAEPSGVPLVVAAAERDVRSAEQSLALERRGIWSGLALEAGIEAHDPTGSETGILPTFGLSIPLPIFSQNHGTVALAAAGRDRARVELAAARRESAALIASARRELAAAAMRATRDRKLVASADRVARMSLQAYAEGAYPLASVLEAQRNARDVLAQLIDDAAALSGAAAALRLYSTTVVQ
ncbi:MAG TPA: TolC family protein [Gemmatimonadaceae bacterium]|nr:TolC family protein [Gemmatimonadaceae bacterium]